jgi:hypothetical protein
VIALQRWPVMIYQGGDFKMPFMQDNVAVLKNKLHMAQIMPYYYPGNYVVFREYGQHSNEVRVSAWDTEVGGVTKLSAFLLPVRPQVGLWYTTAVNWESYPYPQKIVEDLIKQRILYIMTVKDSHLNFEKITDYAVRASQFDRHPKETFYNYNFPPELSEVKY